MKMTLEQTKLVGLTMQLHLCAQEYSRLQKEFDRRKKSLTAQEAVIFRAQFLEKQTQIKDLQSAINHLANTKKPS